MGMISMYKVFCLIRAGNPQCLRDSGFPGLHPLKYSGIVFVIAI